MDRWLALCVTYVFLTLVQIAGHYSFVKHMEEKENKLKFMDKIENNTEELKLSRPTYIPTDLEKRINVMSRVAFPILYIISSTILFSFVNP